MAEEQALAIKIEVPDYYSNAITGDHGMQWKEAIKCELLSLQANNFWNLVSATRTTDRLTVVGYLR